VGSTLSEKAVAGSYSYVLTKHAVAGMMKASCQDLFSTGIHSACICPGFTDTAMLREHVPDNDVLQSIGANNGFGRLVESDEIAALIVWAHQNPVINGAMLHGNLGQKEY
jgi:NAD(P)-dependent dehydrogenase (short-subunit alcohol dehydrogenase family)